ncbi:MAG: hypothetical protein MK066_03060 [Crocinitomicaceae bacterium]|nr:hypothetical protein [Crocinitomicaceae bacterium]
MKRITLLLSVLLLTGVGNDVNAQKLRGRLKDKLSSSQKKEPSKKEEKSLNELNEWHNSHAGEIVFYEKSIQYNSSSSRDSESSSITERAIGTTKPFGFRAYLGKPFDSGCTDCSNLEIKYTIGDVSITTQDLREELAQYYARMASAKSFYDSQNYSVGISMNAAPGKYFDNYTLQEDAYRILLSRVKDKLTPGASVTMKVEIFGVNGDGVIKTEALASGEISLKVTESAYNLQNLNCRCGKAGMTDEKLIKDVKEAFEFQFNDVAKVYQVVLNDRDWTMNYDNSYPTKQIISKGMNANIVYERNDGVFMQVKRYVYFEKTPDGFSDKIKIGKHVYFLPVSPTCIGK